MSTTRRDVPPREPRRPGRPPKGEDDAEALAEMLATLYLREWKAKPLDLRRLYRAPQVRTARERYYPGQPDGTDRAVLLLRRWCARYCGERAVQQALAMGRGGQLRVARIAARILEYRLEHPDLTRLEEADSVGRELGLILDPSAHRRAVEAMLAAVRRYGPELFRELAWTNGETWRRYETRYAVEPPGGPTMHRGARLGLALADDAADGAARRHPTPARQNARKPCANG